MWQDILEKSDCSKQKYFASPSLLFFSFLLLTSARKWSGIILSQFSCLILPGWQAGALWQAALPGEHQHTACTGSPAPLQHGILVNCLHKLTIILSLAIFKAAMGPRVSKSQHWNPYAPWLLRSSGWLSAPRQWSGLLHIHLNILPRCYFKRQVRSTLNLCIWFPL